MIRESDASGVSGTGEVAEGVIFSDGHTVVRWTAPNSPSHSTGIFVSLSEFMMVHVASHPDNGTKIIFDNGDVYDNTTRIPAEEVEKPKRVRKKKEVVATKSS